MWIVKLGGSLATAQELADWLDVLACYGGGRTIIVPGGGVFADAVRDAQETWGFDDAIAHRMALLAMEQYGLMMVGLRSDLVPARSREGMNQVLGQARVAVWMPSLMTEGHPAIRESWDVTSDSLAAWLACDMGAAALFLVKAVVPPDPVVTASELSECGVVDPLFPEMVAGRSLDVRILGKKHFASMKQMLLTGGTGGTRVRTWAGLPGRALPGTPRSPR